MATALRRSFSLRNLLLFRNRSDLSLPTLSHLSSFSETTFLQNPRDCNRLFFDSFIRETRRGFAKGRKSKDDNDTIEVVPDIRPTVKAAAVSLMEAAIVALSRELSKLRTGRASAGMLDHIIVEANGLKMPLSRVAVVSVMDPQTLSVTPYDPNIFRAVLPLPFIGKACITSHKFLCGRLLTICTRKPMSKRGPLSIANALALQTLKELEHAIVSSPLGLNPTLEGQRLVASIPPLTKEHIQAMCKVVTKSSEDFKQSIRRARQKALDSVKKAGSSIPKDDAKRFEKEIDELTKKFVKQADEMCKAKEKEIAGS